MLLLETLNALTDPEREAFARFLSSPFFMHGVRNHRPENLLGLCRFLFENLPGGDTDDFDRERVYGLLFPEKKFSEATVNALASELHRLLRVFLAVQTPQAAEQDALRLARFYRERDMEKAFLKTVDAVSAAAKPATLATCSTRSSVKLPSEKVRFIAGSLTSKCAATSL